MINGIIASIGKAINDEFDKEANIYIEKMDQGFKEPCFFILSINTAERKFFNRRYKFNQSFVIQYFPKNKKSSNEEMFIVADRLMSALEYIEQLGTEEKTILRGKNRNYKIVDGVLNFFVDYDFFAYIEVKEPPFMEVLELRNKGAENGNKQY